MTEQQLIAIALEAGFQSNENADYAMDSTTWVCDLDSIRELVATVTAHERERCAKVCDERSKYWQSDDIRKSEDQMCGIAIRALKD